MATRKAKPTYPEDVYVPTNGGMRRGLDVPGRLLLLETESRGIKDDVAKLIGRFDTFSEEIQSWREGQGKPNWQLIIGFGAIIVTGSGVLLSMLAGAIGILWFTVQSNQANAIAPIKTEIVQMASQQASNTSNINTYLLPKVAEITTQNARSLQDRQDITTRQDRMQSQLNNHDSRLNNAENGLKEVETQFRANDEARNIQFAEGQRKIVEIQNSLHELHAPLPAVPNVPYYAPLIAKPPEDGALH